MVEYDNGSIDNLIKEQNGFTDSIYVHVGPGWMGGDTTDCFHTERSDYYSVDYFNVGFQFQIKANIPINSRLTLFVSQRHFLALNFNINGEY